MKMKVEKSLFQIHFPSSFTIFSSTYGLLVSGVRHFAIAFSYNRIQITRNVQTRDDPTTIDYAQKKKELKQRFITAAHVLCASLLQKFIFNYLQFYCSLIMIHNNCKLIQLSFDEYFISTLSPPPVLHHPRLIVMLNGRLREVLVRDGFPQQTRDGRANCCKQI